MLKMKNVWLVLPLFILAYGPVMNAAENSDNTAINQRDKNSNELTADQQGSSAADTEMTRKIRQELIKDKDLSVYAHNIKIITINGEVTLKGPVRSPEEKKAVVSKAHRVAGAKHVMDEIEIKSN